MHIRRRLKTRTDAAADVGRSSEPRAMRFRTARQVQAAVLGEVGHDAVEVMRVESFGQSIEDRHYLPPVRHFLPQCWSRAIYRSLTRAHGMMRGSGRVRVPIRRSLGKAGWSATERLARVLELGNIDDR